MAMSSLGSVIGIESFGDSFGKLRLCDPLAVRRMEQSLTQLGQVCPVTVFSPMPGVLEVVDGFKRLRAARSLGWHELLAYSLESGTAAEAKLAIIAINEQQGITELEEAWLVRSLYREDRLSQPQIAQRMRRDKSWVCRRLMLAENLDEVVQADVHLGLLSASAAVTIARLQRCNQNAVARLAASRGLTCRQITRLVEELLKAPETQLREQILERWLSAASLEGHPSRPARRVRSVAEWLVTDITTMTRVGARLQARLRSEPLSALGSPAAQVAHESLSSLLAVLTTLAGTITSVTAQAETNVRTKTNTKTTENSHADLDQPRATHPPGGYPQPTGTFAACDRPSVVGQPQHGA
ncbi:MAG: ParB/RepB/Spo0J family partition protein [Sphingomonadaceae bacterium]